MKSAISREEILKLLFEATIIEICYPNSTECIKATLCLQPEETPGEDTAIIEVKENNLVLKFSHLEDANLFVGAEGETYGSYILLEGLRVQIRLFKKTSILP